MSHRHQLNGFAIGVSIFAHFDREAPWMKGQEALGQVTDSQGAAKEEICQHSGKQNKEIREDKPAKVQEAKAPRVELFCRYDAEKTARTGRWARCTQGKRQRRWSAA